MHLPPEMLENNDGRLFGVRQPGRCLDLNVTPCANDGGGPISESATPFNGGA